MNSETQEFVDKMKIKYGKIRVISFGSSLKICKVAEGSANCYPRFGLTMEWDTAAAHAIVLYANKKIIQKDGFSPITYNKEKLLNPHFIVTK